MMLQQFLHEVILFKIAQKVSNILGYFCKQIVSQKLSKIAQSGHNGSIGLWEPPPISEGKLSVERIDGLCPVHDHVSSSSVAANLWIRYTKLKWICNGGRIYWTEVIHKGRNV